MYPLSILIVLQIAAEIIYAYVNQPASNFSFKSIIERDKKNIFMKYRGR